MQTLQQQQKSETEKEKKKVGEGEQNQRERLEAVKMWGKNTMSKMGAKGGQIQYKENKSKLIEEKSTERKVNKKGKSSKNWQKRKVEKGSETAKKEQNKQKELEFWWYRKNAISVPSLSLREAVYTFPADHRSLVK